MRFVPIIFLLWIAAPARALDYRLGQGLDAGPFNLSGYLNTVLKIPRNGQSELELDDLSFFLSGRLNRWLMPFVEVEFSAQPIWVEDDGLFSSGRGKWILERAYNDTWLTPWWSLRIGKMLSPVGEWNLIHAAPLVLTVTRPLTTLRNFSEFATGFATRWVPDGLISEAELYYQPWRELAPKPRNFSPVRYRRLAGGRLVLGDKVDWWLGLSTQAAEERRSQDWQTLFSLDGGLNVGPFSGEFQATYNRIWGNRQPLRTDREWGAYLQGSYHLDESWSLVVRGEGFRDRSEGTASRNELLGLVYNPHPVVRLKLEYVWTQGPDLRLRQGLFTSFSMMY